MVELVEVLSSNRKLVNLDLSWNTIWESEPTKISTNLEALKIKKSEKESKLNKSATKLKSQNEIITAQPS